eukprot:GCRY01006191.1.p1 GENE.GCRY01006191.1~~GCRY01006191.1.p1  ORF type:complete len:384 (+),score=7.06 GCRY01006191.1:425-1576(+)
MSVFLILSHFFMFKMNFHLENDNDFGILFLILDMLDNEDLDLDLDIFSNEEILACLLHEKEKRSLHSPPLTGGFDIENLSRPCTELFRFEKEEIILLANHLLPEYVVTPNRCRIPRIEAMALVLRRLSYPNRWCDLVSLFSRKDAVLSAAFKQTVGILHDKCKHLCLFDFERIRNDVNRFCEANREKGSPLPMCFGFVDGTFRRSCRPTYNQRVAFSGHKRLHGIKFQGVSTPNGIIQEMYGPVPAHRHDARILRESGLLEKLKNNCELNGEWVYLYGDPAYPNRPFLIRPYTGHHLTAEQNAFNYRMSKVRQSVEWAFKDIIQYFSFLDYSKNLKIYLQPIAQYYQVGAFLMNCLTCFRRGNQTSIYFNCDPPTIEEYLSYI